MALHPSDIVARIKSGKFSRHAATFDTLLGRTLMHVEEIKEPESMIVFVTFNDEVFLQTHRQDCCESVGIESIVGDLRDLEYAPILVAEESSSDATTDAESGSATWTFYKLATRKGYVDIRWLGTSNGYYSERVDFYQLGF